MVDLIVNIIEPYHRRLFDPASGSGGMFVSSAEFVRRHRRAAPSPGAPLHPLPVGEGRGEGVLSIYGQERVAETIRLFINRPTAARNR